MVHVRSCRRLLRSNGWWEMVWTTYTDERFKKTQVKLKSKQQPLLAWFCITSALKRVMPSAAAYFSVNDSVELFGVTIDKDLTFKQHVSSICKKVNNQFGVMTRFGKRMSIETMLCLFKAFILPRFYYCSMVWHFSSKQDSDKLDLLNKLILWFIFKDFNSEYNNLLEKAGTANLKDKRLQNMLLTIFKCLNFSDYPRYLKDMFRLHSSTYFLRGHNMPCLPRPLTTYGINSFSYLAATLPHYFWFYFFLRTDIYWEQ